MKFGSGSESTPPTNDWSHFFVFDTMVARRNQHKPAGAKKQAPSKAQQKKLEAFNDDSSDEDVPPPQKNKANKKGRSSAKPFNSKVTKKKEPEPAPSSSDDSSSEDSDNEVAPKPLAKAPRQDESSSEEESSSDEGSDHEPNAGDVPLFSDKNASWLKPKKQKEQLLSSDEEDEEEAASSSDDSDKEEIEDEAEELLEIEKEAQMVDDEMELEREEAEEEMRRTVREHTAIYHLPTTQELEDDADRVVPPSEIRSHIDSILEVLADFKTRREPGRARKEYMDQLGAFIAELYGYLPELVEYFLTMFSPAEALEFIDKSDQTRPLVIRTNTLKARRKDLAAALMKRGVSLDPLANWSKVGLKIVESPVPIGATPEYLSGMYMLQSAASMCPVLALAPEPKEKVLDVSAAPGGKTSYIAQLMKNTGTIFANDLKAERQKATVANMHRLGVKNVIACKHDGRKLGTLFKNRFDRILLDAPCSGLGVISRDPSVKVQRTIADVNQCAHLQKELLLAAIDALKYKGTTGGVMVYSTCSVSVAENEEVVNYALSKRDIKIIDSGLDFGKPGFTRYQQKRFHPSIALTRRFYPHVHNMDGFFVAKIQKLSDKRLGETAPTEAVIEEQTENVESDGEEAAKLAPAKKAGKAADRKRKREPEKVVRKEKSATVSIPPKKPKQKKPKQNAKTTKPRRNRAAADA